MAGSGPSARLLERYGAFRKSAIGEAIEAVGLAAGLSVFLRLLVFQAFFIPSRSMAETLEPPDRILTEKATLPFRSPERGEIVIFDFEGFETPDALLATGDADEETESGEAGQLPREFVKRVVGVEGDVISIAGGVLLVNSEPDPRSRGEAFVFRIPGERVNAQGNDALIDGRRLDEVLPATMPAEAIEDRSSENLRRLGGYGIGVLKLRVPRGFVYVMGDNRAESVDSRYFGLVSLENVRGRALFTYWPPSRRRGLL